jgi:hypothetical protein
MAIIESTAVTCVNSNMVSEIDPQHYKKLTVDESVSNRQPRANNKSRTQRMEPLSSVSTSCIGLDQGYVTSPLATSYVEFDDRSATTKWDSPETSDSYLQRDQVTTQPPRPITKEMRKLFVGGLPKDGT